jgi:hypothetical protein
MAESNLESEIRTNAAGPQQASGDQGSMTQHPLPDQIAAAKFLGQTTAAKRSDRGIRFTKLRPGGAD